MASKNRHVTDIKLHTFSDACALIRIDVPDLGVDVLEEGVSWLSLSDIPFGMVFPLLLKTQETYYLLLSVRLYIFLGLLFSN